MKMLYNPPHKVPHKRTKFCAGFLGVGCGCGCGLMVLGIVKLGFLGYCFFYDRWNP